MKESIDSTNFVESFNPTPRSGVRTLAPTPEDLKNGKRMLKEDVETSSKTLNPTPKAGVKTLAPTPENLSKRLMKESIDTTDFTGINLCKLPNLIFVNIEGTESNFDEQNYECATKFDDGKYDMKLEKPRKSGFFEPTSSTNMYGNFKYN